MSWIHEIAPEQAEGELKPLYRELEQRRGKVAHTLQVHSLRPAARRAHLQLYQDLLFASGGLSRREREMIAVVVSRENGCDYCIAHHREALSHYVADADWLDRLVNGDEWPDLPGADRLLLKYAGRLTRTPDAVSEDDVAVLPDRQASLELGFDYQSLREAFVPIWPRTSA